MRSGLITFLVLAALAALAAPAEASPAWLAPAPLSAPGEASNQPHTAMDAAGDAVVAWNHYDGAGSYQVVVVSRAAGGAWSPPTHFPAGSLLGESQVAIGPTGEAVVVFRHELGSSAPIEASWAPAGGAWTTPIAISEVGKLDSEPSVAVDPRGGVTALWREKDATRYGVWEATRTPGGGWGPSTNITVAGGKISWPRIALEAAGGAVAVWAGEEAGNYFRIESSSRSAGGDWGPPVPLSPAGGFAYVPELAMSPSGLAVVGWVQKGKSGNNGVRLSTRPPGAVWQLPAIELSDPEVGAGSPRVAVDERGDATATWLEAGGKQTAVRGSRIVPGGGWSPPTTITDPGEMAAEMAMGVDAPGDATVLWSNGAGAGAVMRATRWTAGAAPAPPVTVSEPGLGPESPGVATDTAGDALGVWGGNPGGKETIEAAGFDGAGPALRSLSIPSTGSVGAPLSFSVAPLDVFSSVAGVSWDFGDGGTATGTQAGHTYSRPGTYTVSVESGDTLGNASRATGTVTISAVAAAPVPASPSAKGSAHAGRFVRVRGGKALVTMTCGGATCEGVLKLEVPAPKRRGRTDRKGRAALLLAKARFKLQTGAKKTVAMALRKRSLARLGHHPAQLSARLEGVGITARPVVVTFPTKHHRGAKGKR